MKKKYICLYYNIDGKEVTSQYPAGNRSSDKLARVMAASIAEEGNPAYAYSIKTYKEVNLEYIQTEESGKRYINGCVITKDVIERTDIPEKDDIAALMDLLNTDKAVCISESALIYPFIEGKDQVVRIERLNREDMVEGQDI